MSDHGHVATALRTYLHEHGGGVIYPPTPRTKPVAKMSHVLCGVSVPTQLNNDRQDLPDALPPEAKWKTAQWNAFPAANGGQQKICRTIVTIRG